MLLDPGMDLTLRPMKYPHFFDRFKDAIKNTWTVEEVDLHADLADLARLSAAEQHLVSRLVAFFATVISTVIGTMVAMSLVRGRFPGKNLLDAVLYLPVVIPEITQAISLAVFFKIVFDFVNAATDSRTLTTGFATIINDTVVSPWVSEQIVNILLENTIRDRLPAYLWDVPVADKPGNLVGSVNDTGIIFLDSGPRAVAAYSAAVPDDLVATDVLALLGLIAAGKRHVG